MSPEHLSHDAETETAAAMAAASPACYIEPAPLMEVMFEQLEFLVNHQESGCPPECAECARLAQVRHTLLSPFGLVN